MYVYILELELYSSVRNFVIAGTEENGENWYMTNNNQFTLVHCSFDEYLKEFFNIYNFIEKFLTSFAVMTKTPWQLWHR